MPVITIGLNNEVLGVNTYDVFVSNCVNPPVWTIVADDITFNQFPWTFLDSAYGITGTCYTYYVSGDTGCSCEGTGYTVSPSVTPTMTVTPSITPTITPSPVSPSVTPTVTATPSITPTITPSISITPTPTPSPITCDELVPLNITGGSSTFNMYNGYIVDTGANSYNSLCDAILCNSIDGGDISMDGRLFTGGTYIPLSGLSETSTGATPLYTSACTQYTNTTFYDPDNFDGSSFSMDTLVYVSVSGTSGYSVYEIGPDGVGDMYISLYATCDFSGTTEPIVGFDVDLNGSGQWVINGEVEPNLTLECGVEYNFHICSSGATTQFWMADVFNASSESTPDGGDALTSSDGVDNNGEYLGTITATFTSSGTDGGYWYGTNGIEGAAGQITVTGC